MAYKSITLEYLVVMNFIHSYSSVMFIIKPMNICNDSMNYDEIIIIQSLVYKHSI